MCLLNINVDAAGITFREVMNAFKARFLPARVKFDVAGQGPSYTILNYRSRMRSLFNRAYPNAANDFILIGRFIIDWGEGNYPGTYTRASEQSFCDLDGQGYWAGCHRQRQGAHGDRIHGRPQEGDQRHEIICHFCKKAKKGDDPQ